MTCTEVAVPYVDVLCGIITDYVIITIADVAVVDIDVWSPDGDAIGVVGSFACACLRSRFADGNIVNRSVVSFSAVTDGDVDTRSILYLEVAEQEARALFEANHRSWIEGLSIFSCEPPSSALTIDDGSNALTFDDDVVLFSVLASDKNLFGVR